MSGGSLSGKVAAVTGGGRGMGRAIALAFADEGADVALIDRMPDHLDEVAYEIAARGRRSFVVEADVVDVPRLPAVFDSIVAALGDLHILMNNAGISPEAPALETTEELWDTIMDVNAKGLFFCAQQAGRHFLARGGGGKIVNTSSTYGVTVEPGLSAYAASKGAVLQVTRALAAEWARHGINVNAIGPTLIGTDMTRDLLADQGYMDTFLEKLPARALPTPTDIADAAVFLAGPRSDLVHGHLLLVDSGELAV
jgi:NAD(P)-dependent dehydrogenase (short-subunit alcohol dehydrogenase family)